MTDKELQFPATTVHLMPSFINASLRLPGSQLQSARGELIQLLLAVIVLAGFASCSTIATYDETAYEKATAAKAEALVLMDKAVDPYSEHRVEAEGVSLNIEKAYQYDLGRIRNSETVRQWEILKNPDGNLYGGFIRRWKEKGRLKPDAIEIKKPDIADAFDQIIALEAGKRKITTN